MKMTAKQQAERLRNVKTLNADSTGSRREPVSTSSNSYRVIIDIEGTCADQRSPEFDLKRSEIVSIGACLVDAKCNIVDEFYELVKPEIQPTLTPFCTEFLGISQDQVDNADPYSVVQEKLDNWISESEKKYGNIIEWGSWGGYDKRQFLRNVEMLKTRKPDFLELPYLNLKDEYALMHAGIIKRKKAPGIGLAMFKQNMEFTGTRHNALDDARNTVKLAKIIFGIEHSRHSTTDVSCDPSP
ncbi:3'-5' exonuclease (plasmid) [Pseudomonas sp. FeN3W]|nr:3'-5' exonuclease [Pseudomonas sp. FeN3W]